MKHNPILCLALTLMFGFSTRTHAQLTLSSNALAAFSAAGEREALSDFDFGDKKKKKKKQSRDGGGADFQHAVGGSIFAAPSTATEGEDNSAVAFALSYFPSIRVAELGEKLSLRLGVSPSFGINGSVNSREGGNLSIAYELPADVELHFGNQEMEGFGGHLGAGFAYNHMASTETGNNKAYGPHVTAGIKGMFKERMYTIRAGFLLNINNKKDLFGYDGKNVISASIAGYF